MSADPLSVTGGAGPIVTASLVNSQAQTQAKTQAVADTSGTTPQKEIVRNTDEQNPATTNKPTAGDSKNAPDDKPLTMEEAVATFKDYVEHLPSDLKFHVDKDTSRVVFKIVNPVTEEVVKQFPPDEFLEMVKKLKEAAENFGDHGVFFNERS